jgi:hypothetical protein
VERFDGWRGGGRSIAFSHSLTRLFPSGVAAWHAHAHASTRSFLPATCTRIAEGRPTMPPRRGAAGGRSGDENGGAAPDANAPPPTQPPATVPSQRATQYGTRDDEETRRLRQEIRAVKSRAMGGFLFWCKSAQRARALPSNPPSSHSLSASLSLPKHSRPGRPDRPDDPPPGAGAGPPEPAASARCVKGEGRRSSAAQNSLSRPLTHTKKKLRSNTTVTRPREQAEEADAFDMIAQRGLESAQLLAAGGKVRKEGERERKRGRTASYCWKKKENSPPPPKKNTKPKKHRTARPASWSAP